MREAILRCEQLEVRLGQGGAQARIVRGVDLAVSAGEVLGLVGESGCGKTTLARTLLGMQRETTGGIHWKGQLVSGVAPRQARALRRAIQYVHQDPGAALDPWWAIGRTLNEALVIWGVHDAAVRMQRITRVMQAVGLSAEFLASYPHELSGGQLRRVGLARILVLEPELVILDEPSAGLDLSVQAAVLKLVMALRETLGLTILFISHDLSVVRRLCDRVAVMYLGRVVELAPVDTLFKRPAHPYTRSLLQAAPTLDTSARLQHFELPGDPPSVLSPDQGCMFAPRCAHASATCREERPVLQPTAPAAAKVAPHQVACWHAEVSE